MNKNIEEMQTLYAQIARAYLKEKKVYRYRMKKICDMSDEEVITKCHWWYEENNMTEDYNAFEENYLANMQETSMESFR